MIPLSIGDKIELEGVGLCAFNGPAMGANPILCCFSYEDTGWGGKKFTQNITVKTEDIIRLGFDPCLK